MGDKSRLKCDKDIEDILCKSNDDLSDSSDVGSSSSCNLHSIKNKSSNVKVPQKVVPEKKESIKLRLRRSTEQSNYKIIETGTRHSSRLSQIPKKSLMEESTDVSTDEDEYEGKRVPITPKSKVGNRNDSRNVNFDDQNHNKKVLETPRTKARNSMVQSVEKMTLNTPRSTGARRTELQHLIGDCIKHRNNQNVEKVAPETPRTSRLRSLAVQTKNQIENSTKSLTSNDKVASQTPRAARARSAEVQNEMNNLGKSFKNANDKNLMEIETMELATPRKTRAGRVDDQNEMISKGNSIKDIDFDVKHQMEVETMELVTPRKTRSRSVETQNEIVNKENTSRNVQFDVEIDDEREMILATPRSTRKTRRNLTSIIEQDENVIQSKKNKRVTKSQSELSDDDDDDADYQKAKRGLVTPKKTPRSIKIKTLTPSMKQRTVNIIKMKSVLEEARAQLHVSAVPKSLPCREKEFNDIFTFLNGKLLDGSSGCMYISGVPGTGKTATVNEVLRGLKRLVAKGELDDFDYVEINGMKLSEPRQSYVQIMKQLTGISTSWEEALSNLNKRFNDKAATNKRKKDKGKMTLLLIDELDLLCNKRQDVVYNLLDWPSKSAAQLVVITIANTMDLPERVLMSRVTSRLGLTRLTFHPYNFKQLQEIIITRLKESEVFKSDAIQLVARKVAAVSGDARRALDICRRTTEIAELHGSDIVSMQHVNEALVEMIANAKVRAIKFCSQMEKLFLQSVCAEIKRTGIEETNFINIYKQLQSIFSFKGKKCPNVTQTLEISARLCANRLILSDNTKLDIQQRIFLNVSVDDIYYALEDIEL